MRPQQKPIRNPILICEKVDDGSVIVSPTAGKIRVVNKVGAYIWELLDGENKLADIEDKLTQKFSKVPPAQLQTDLHNFLNELEQRGLLSWQA